MKSLLFYKSVKHYIIYFVATYVILSICEYLIHRFLMHTNFSSIGKSHLIHHKNTRKDMTLDTNGDDYDQILPSENLVLDSGIENSAVFIVSVLIVLGFYRYYPVKLNFKVLIGIQVLFGIYILLTWNSIHTFLHGRDGQKMGYFSLCNKSTKYLVERSSFLRWLIRNHVAHHNIKGDKKGNYNITLPGADFLFNTYNVYQS